MLRSLIANVAKPSALRMVRPAINQVKVNNK